MDTLGIDLCTDSLWRFLQSGGTGPGVLKLSSCFTSAFSSPKLEGLLAHELSGGTGPGVLVLSSWFTSAFPSPKLEGLLAHELKSS